MLTYEDYLAVQDSEKKKIEFILAAIKEHTSSPAYKEAVAAQKYYDGENPTIYGYEKVIYDLAGRAHVDMWTANHKIASSFFTFVIDQEVSYLLGNGVRFTGKDTKAKLGKDFDQEVMDGLEYARIGGTSFGFWNLDHVDVFKITEFAPIYSEESGDLALGVRFWQLDPDKPLHMTFYELDGYTEYIQRKGEDAMVYREKQAYKQTVISTPAEGVIRSNGGNYGSFPIVPLYSNKQHQSALRGRRNTVDALDLATSNMVNNVDEGNLIYWVLTNCGGMDDIDDAKFMERLKTTRVAHADGDAGAKAEAHTLEAPYTGTKVTIDMLIDRLYEDFQAFDANSITASDMSATAIRAGYARLDMKCDKLERQVTRFINGILELAGIDDTPSYQRSPLINTTEETQKIIMQAQYFDEDYIRQKLLTINGDIDMYDEISKRMDAEGADRLKEIERRLNDAGGQEGAVNE